MGVLHCTPRTRLERELHPELHDPPVVGRGDLTEGRRADRAVRLAEALLVEDVERFDAQLDLLSQYTTLRRPPSLKAS